MRSDLPASRVAGGIFIGNVIIMGLAITGLSMMLAAVLLVTAGA